MKTVLSLLLCLVALSSFAETAAEKNARMKWWKEARFGMFLHWGLYAVPSGEWQGKTGYAEWILEEAHIPVAQYELFEKQFNPVKFDADKWVRMAKEAGMKYVVITTKHHEGFNMFASKYSDYNIMNTPFHKDVMKAMAAACKRYGLKMCWYHSIMDWHHPDYLPRRSWEDRPKDGADFRKYVAYLRNEVTQLLTQYGPIGVMWFDGEWESTWNHEDGQALYDLCRKLQPNVIVNNRVDVGRSGVAGMSTVNGTAGDYGTPEQEIPAQGIPDSYWETCMTMNDHWGYNKNDFNYKSPRDLIRKLVDIASKGGNFLLNIGPTPLGEFPPMAQERLQSLGAWTKTNGEAIYGTDASPFEKLDWGRCTVGKLSGHTTLFLHVFDWPASGKLTVPGLGNQPVKAFELARPSKSLPIARDGANLVISVPGEAPDADCSVIALEIKGTPIVYQAPKILAATDMVLQPVQVTLNAGSPSLDIRYTTDGSDPREGSAKYQGPITVSDGEVLKAQTFADGKPVSAIVEKRFQTVTANPAMTVDSPAAGLTYSVYAGKWETVPNYSALQPESSGVLTAIGLSRWPAREYYGIRAQGYINVSEDSVYVFTLGSDDGSRLSIDGKVVIDDDGLHSMTFKDGAIPLAKGYHSITLDYFNGTGDSGLSLQWSKPGDHPQDVAAGAFFHAGT